MKGQSNIGHFFFSAIPKKKNIFFVGKELIDKFLWQFFTRLYQFYYSILSVSFKFITFSLFSVI